MLPGGSRIACMIYHYRTCCLLWIGSALRVLRWCTTSHKGRLGSTVDGLGDLSDDDLSVDDLSMKDLSVDDIYL